MADPRWENILIMKILFHGLVFFLLFSCNNNETKSHSKITSFIEPKIATIGMLRNLLSKDFPNLSINKIFKGQLNSDSTEDIILIAEENCDSSYVIGVEGSACRNLMLIVNQKGTYKIAATNKYIIECSQCGGAGVGDPFQNLVIENGIFKIFSLYGACDKTASTETFQFDPVLNDWLLKEVIREDYTCREEENLNGEIKVSSEIWNQKDLGKVTFSKYKP